MVNQLRSEHLKEKKHATNWHEFHKLWRAHYTGDYPGVCILIPINHFLLLSGCW